MTTPERAAMRQALEALELKREPRIVEEALAIIALREALSQPEPHTDHPLRHYDRTCPACNAEQQEPVAYIQRRMVDSYPAPGFETCSKDDFDAIPVYTHPAREPELPPPPECKTEEEKRAYAFGWFKALEVNRRKP